MAILDFEKSIYDLEAKISELKDFGADNGGKVSLDSEVKKLEQKLVQMREEVYGNLSIWQRVLIARHPDRPYTLDYIRMITTNFVELHGDRLFWDDLAMVAGFATIGDQRVMIMGQQKGRDTNENVKRNFGCAHPEGYRKAMRLMEMASKFGLPIVILIDTPGAYPGIGAEERGQAQAIAENLRDMMRIETPIIATIIGEGGSGGALGIGVADRVMILEHAYYSVISPEGCASILWRNSVKAPEAAEALKVTGENLVRFGIVDEVVKEPLGGAHHDPEFVAENLKTAILNHIKELLPVETETLRQNRYEKYRQIGEFSENSTAAK